MTSSNVKSKLGSTQLIDPKTDLFLKLPPGFRLYASTGRFWIGGDQDSGDYLHIERMSATDNIPTVLAEGDLDMYLAAKNKIETITDRLSGVWVSGSIGEKEVMGFLAKVAYTKTDCYLVLIAREKGNKIGIEKKIALEIALQILE